MRVNTGMQWAIWGHIIKSPFYQGDVGGLLNLHSPFVSRDTWGFL